MTDLEALLDEVQRLPADQKWRLVRALLNALEGERAPGGPREDWADFLRATYGSLRDSGLERWEPGDAEDREPFE